MTSLLVGLAASVVVLLWTSPPPVAWTPTTEVDRWGPWSQVIPGRAGGGGRRVRRAPPRGLVPEAMELLALALQGGGSLTEAARTVSLVLPDAAGAGLARVADALHRGQDTEQAWSAAGQDWEPARRSLELARVAGVAPGPTLRQAAADLRAGMVADVEIGTARLGVRMVLPLGLAFLPAFVLTTVLPLVLALTQDLTW